MKNSKPEKQQLDEEIDLLYRKGIINIDELDEMSKQKRNTRDKIHENV